MVYRPGCGSWTWKVSVGSCNTRCTCTDVGKWLVKNSLAQLFNLLTQSMYLPVVSPTVNKKAHRTTVVNKMLLCRINLLMPIALWIWNAPRFHRLKGDKNTTFLKRCLWQQNAFVYCYFDFPSRKLCFFKSPGNSLLHSPPRAEHSILATWIIERLRLTKQWQITGYDSLARTMWQLVISSNWVAACFYLFSICVLCRWSWFCYLTLSDSSTQLTKLFFT